MVKGLFTIGLFLVGGAGFAGIAYVQSHPLALTRPVPIGVASLEIPLARRDPVQTAPLVAPETVSLPAPPATPSVTTRVSSRRARPTPSGTAIDLRPCSH